MKKTLLCCAAFSAFSAQASSSCQSLSVPDEKQTMIVTGTFDHNGQACVQVPLSEKQVVIAESENIRDLSLYDSQMTPRRTLITDNPVTEMQSVSFTLPFDDTWTLAPQGVPGSEWKLALTNYSCQPVAENISLPVDSVRLQQLITLINGRDTSAFWQAVTETPLVEEYDEHHKRITFLWRGAKVNAYILGAPSGQHDPMARLNDTDIWYRSYIVPAGTFSQYKIAPDIPLLDGSVEGARRKALLSTAQADPRNPLSAGADGADEFNRHAIIALDNNRICDFRTTGQQPVSGTVALHSLRSQILNNQREIAVYTPAAPGKEPWLLVLFDGQIYRKNYHIVTFIDQWLTRGEIPPLYVVMVDSISSEQRGKELPPNEQFPQFLDKELMPWLVQQGIDIPAARTIISGSSYGGLASSWNAMKLPHRFGNVLSMSGSYWWSPEGEPPEWLIREFAGTHKLPLRFFLEAGVFETRAGAGGILHNNRALHQVLQEKGYDVVREERPGGHDYVSWCETLQSGLIHLTDTKGSQ